MSLRSVGWFVAGGIVALGATAAMGSARADALAPSCIEVSVGAGFAEQVAKGLVAGIATQRTAGYANVAPVMLQNNHAMVCGW